MDSPPDVAEVIIVHRLLHPMPGLHWSEIRATAVDCAAHGWPVVPGSYRFDDTGPWLGTTTDQLAPVDRWRGSLLSAAEAEELWTARPYTVLLDLRPGWGTIPVSGRHVRGASEALRAAGVAAPIVSTGALAHIIVVSAAPAPVRGLNAWVPLPPGVTCGQVSRWVAHPDVCGWAPPPVASVLAALSHKAEGAARQRLSRSA